MNKAAKEARRAYKRKWQRENPDKVKEYQARYWDKKAREAAAAAAAAGDPGQEGSNPQEV